MSAPQAAPAPQPDLFDGTIGAVIFDLDGVITDTASIHGRAWKQMFDEELARRAAAEGTEPVPFTESDYLTYVDGKPRVDGVRSFVASRGIELPEGDPDDPPGTITVHGLGRRKDRLFNEILDREGAEVFTGTLRLIELLRDRGIRTGCVSSSKNCRPVLASVDLLDHFDQIIDGIDAGERGLAGKPDPETYLVCARDLDVDPADAAMVEDAVSGVASGAAGGFRHVIGVDRGAGRSTLLAAGATVVVDDLAELVPPGG